MAGPEKKMRIANKLRQTEVRYRELFDSINVCVAVYKAKNGGEDFVIKDFNTAAEKVEKVNRQDIIGKSILEVFPWIREFGIFEVMQRVWKTAVPESFPAKFYRDNRIRGWRTSYIYKLPSGDIVVVYEDVTDGMKAIEALKEAELRYRTVADFTYDWEFWIGTEGKFNYVSPSCKRITGYPPGQFFKKPNFMDKLVLAEDRRLWATHQQKFRGGIADECIFRIKCKDGQVRWIEQVCRPIVDDNDQFLGTRGTNRDITDRRQTEQALSNSKAQLSEKEAMFKVVFGNQYLLTGLLDPEGRLLAANSTALNFAGVTEEKVIGKWFWETPWWQHSAEVREQLKSAIKNASMGKFIRYETSHVNAQGQIRQSDFTLNPVMDDAGNVIYIIPEARDITEYLKAQQTLKESEEKYRSVLENAGESIYIAADNRIVFANKRTSEITRYSQQELYGRPFADFIYPTDREMVVNRYLARLRGEKVDPLYSFRLIGGDGNLMWIELRATPIEWEGRPATLNFLTDITTSKKAEKAIEHSNRRLADIIDFLPDATFVIDDSDKVVLWNRAMTEMTGVPDSEMVGRGDRIFTIPFYGESRPHLMDLIWSDHADISARYTNVERHGNSLSAEAFCPALRQGKGAWVLAKTCPLHDKDGNTVGAIESIRDITEQKMAEDTLRKSEEQYRLLAENTDDVIWTLDAKMNYTYISPSIRKLSGFEPEEAMQLPLEKVLTPQSQQSMLHELELDWDNIIQGKHESRKIEFEQYRKDGSTVWVETVVQALYDEAGQLSGFMGSSRDISDRKRFQDEQVRLAKLQSVGTLAGGIAHDFNNILGAVLGNVSLARAEIPPANPAYDCLLDAEKAVLRARDLTKQLLTFSRGGTPVKKITWLTDTIMDTANFAVSGSSAICHFSIEDSLWPANVDEGQIGQVISNLVINARQAMPAGGLIKVKAENIVLGEEHSIGKSLPLAPGNYIRITVQDHGTGIPDENVSRIFDPYFTTKKDGTGLGLAICFSIIHNHGGHISVESAPGQGSAFFVYLPAYLDEIKHTRKEEHQDKVRLNVRILVMDDDAALRATIKSMLKHIGFEHVTTAASGEEAIRLYRKALTLKEPFDTVILDLTVPGGMGGKETMEKLLEIDQGVVAIVSSGYTEESAMAEYEKYGFKGVITKPYTADELKRALYLVLGELD
jgi:PAS domain S-box-containing protein